MLFSYKFHFFVKQKPPMRRLLIDQENSIWGENLT